MLVAQECGQLGGGLFEHPGAQEIIRTQGAAPGRQFGKQVEVEGKRCPRHAIGESSHNLRVVGEDGGHGGLANAWSATDGGEDLKDRGSIFACNAEARFEVMQVVFAAHDQRR